MLKIHELTLLSEAREYVLMKKQMKPAISSIGIKQLEEAMISDLEGTIMGIVAESQHWRGIVKVGNAISSRKTGQKHLQDSGTP